MANDTNVLIQVVFLIAAICTIMGVSIKHKILPSNFPYYEILFLKPDGERLIDAIVRGPDGQSYDIAKQNPIQVNAESWRNGSELVVRLKSKDIYKVVMFNRPRNKNFIIIRIDI